MPGRTRGVRHPTPGARPPNEPIASSTSMAQTLAPSDRRSDSNDDGEEKEENFSPVPAETEDEFPNSSNALVVDGIVIPVAARKISSGPQP